MNRSRLIHEIVFNDEDFAQKYAKHHQKMTEKFGYEYAQKLKSRGFQKGKMIDVGCGAGGTAVVLAKMFADCEVVGIDLSEPLLKIAEGSNQAAQLGERIKFEKADVQQIPYPDNSFDVVINLNMVHLVEDPISMLNEMERILKPDGFLFIADLRRSWLGIIEKEIKSSLTLSEASELFKQSSLREGVFSSSFLWWRFEVGE
ncbi:MAG: class I SAM-dependent methyltransferase [bacterium]|nr:MAG: class I SAM-dependent methyltransferase [bacterium]